MGRNPKVPPPLFQPGGKVLNALTDVCHRWIRGDTLSEEALRNVSVIVLDEDNAEWFEDMIRQAGWQKNR